jgi:hypothetical protein
MQQTMDSISGVFVAVYVASVIYNKKLADLFKLLMGEVGYLEFLVALFVLYQLTINKWTSGPTWVFIALGVLSSLLYLAARYDFGTVLTDFGTGKVGLFDTLTALARRFRFNSVANDLIEV